MTARSCLTGLRLEELPQTSPTRLRPLDLSGLMQINLTVPQGASTGAAVPLQLSIGTAKSPLGVTIAVE